LITFFLDPDSHKVNKDQVQVQRIECKIRANLFINLLRKVPGSEYTAEQVVSQSTSNLYEHTTFKRKLKVNTPLVKGKTNTPLFKL
jgi:hypothetical protein